MQALTVDNLLPLEEYAARRREFFVAHQRYLDRYRRVRLGPAVTLIFENRQTLWYRVQEVVRIARLNEPSRIRMELDIHNRLLPGRDRLQAALLIAIADETRLREELTPWQNLRGEQLTLNAGPMRYPANLLTCRPQDRCIGAAHWVQFVLDADGRAALCDSRMPAHLAIRMPGYEHDSGPLADDIRRSLVEDLALSDRAA